MPHRRGRLLQVFAVLVGVAAATPVTAADGDWSIRGPSVLAPAERAVYRVEVDGDRRVDACELGLKITIPDGFAVVGTRPTSVWHESERRVLRFTAQPRLGARDRLAFDLEIEAGSEPTAGSLCVELEYRDCTGTVKDVQIAGPACSPLAVDVDRRPDDVEALALVPCGRPATVVNGGGTVAAADWDDAPVFPMPTTPALQLQAKTAGGDLYVQATIADGAIDPQDGFLLFIDVTGDGGVPEAVDRALRIQRSGVLAMFGGSPTGFNVPLPTRFNAELQEGSGEWRLELRLPLVEIGGPRDPHDVRLAVRVLNGPSTSVWPAAFDGVNESAMAPVTLRTCVPGRCSFTTWATAIDPLDENGLTNPQRVIDDLLGPNGTSAIYMYDGSAVRLTGFDRFNSTGAIRSVEAMLYLSLAAPATRDLRLEVLRNNGRLLRVDVPVATVNQRVGNPGFLAVDVTAAGLTMADLATSVDLDLAIEARGDDNVATSFDAVGFRVTTDGTCGQPSGGANLQVRVDDGFAEVQSGQLVDINIVYGNRGNAAATDVVLTDLLSPELRYHRGRTGTSGVPGALTIEYSTNGGSSWSATEPPENAPNVGVRLRAGVVPASPTESYTLTFGARVASSVRLGDRVTNRVTATLTQNDLNLTDNADADDGDLPGDDRGDRVGDYAIPFVPVPCGELPPALDGDIELATEWLHSGMVTTTMIGNNGGTEAIVIYAYHDAGEVHFGFDVADDSANNSDTMYVLFDLDRDRVDPDSSDRQYRIQRNGQMGVRPGLGSNTDSQLWSGGSVATSMRGATRSNSAGWTAEISIPFSELPGLNGSQQTGVVGLVYFSTHGGGTWTGVASARFGDASSWAVGGFDRCQPLPDFAAADACVGQSVQFLDQSTNDPISWLWQFGVLPPVTSTDQNPTFSYSLPGSYPVWMQSCNWAGCDSLIRNVEVHPVPTPLVRATPPSPICIDASVPTLIDLDGTLSRIPVGATAADPGGYLWSTTLGTVTGLLGSREILTVPADTTGRADIDLTLVDSRSCADTFRLPIDLVRPPVAGLIADDVCGNPSAASLTDLSAATSVVTPPATATAYAWTPPPGTAVVGTGPDVQLSIPAGTFGSLTASVLVSDSNGCSHLASDDLYVNRPPGVTVVASPSRMCTIETADFPVALAASAVAGDGNVINNGYRWSPSGVGSVGSSGLASEVLTVPAGHVGFVGACADAIDDRTCRSALGCDTVEVIARPQPRFTALLPSNGCTDHDADIVIDLDARSSSWGSPIPDPAGFSWTTTEGTIVPATGSRPQLVLSRGFSGPVDVTLTVTGAPAPCAKALTQRLILKPGPTVDLALPFAERCTDPLADMVVTLDAGASSSPDGITDPSGYRWTVVPALPLSRTDGSTTTVTVPAGFIGDVLATVDVTDDASCSRSLDKTLRFVEQPIARLASDSALQCGPTNSFELDTTTSSGTPPLGVTWSATPVSQVSFVPLTPGGTRVRADVAVGHYGPIDIDAIVASGSCEDTVSVRLFASPGPSPVVVVDAQQCAGPDPLMFVAGSTGTTGPAAIDPSGYRWSVAPVGSVSPAVGTATTVSVPAGWSGSLTLTLEVGDQDGCVQRVDQVIPIAAPMVADLDVAASTSCDLGNGVSYDLTASTTSLNGPIGYLWSGLPLGKVTFVPLTPDGSQVRAQIAVGYRGPIDVEVTLSDAAGCEATRQVQLFASPGPTPVIDVAATECAHPTDPLTFGADGSTSISLAGIDPSGFRWSVAPVGSVVPATGPTTTVTVPAGWSGPLTLTLDVEDRDGCMRSLDQVIEIHPPAVASFSPDRVADCDRTGTGLSFTLDGGASSGQAPLAYSWTVVTPGAGSVVPTGVLGVGRLDVTPGFRGLVTVALTVTDANGCQHTSEQSVEAGVGPDVLVQATPGLCSPTTDQSIRLDASGSSSPAGIDPGGFVWSSVFTLSATSGPVTFLTVPAGHVGPVTASVTVTDRDGCARVDNVSFDAYPLPAPDVGVVGAVCSADLEQGTALAAIVGTVVTDPNGYQWSSVPGRVATPNGAANTLFVPGGYVGPIDVTLIVVDDNLCNGSVTKRLMVHDRPAPAITVDAGNRCDAVGGTRFSFDASGSTSAATPLAFAWTTTSTGTLSSPNGSTTDLDLIAGTTGPALVEVEVIDANGCRRSLDRVVTVDPEPTASIVVGNSSGCTVPGQPIEFHLDGSGSTVAAPGTLTGFDWSVDPPGIVVVDGLPTATIRFPPGTAPGSYNATLQVATDASCGATDQVPLTVRSDAPPVARVVTATPAICADGVTPTVVSFDAGTSTASLPATIQSYAWMASGGVLGGGGSSLATVTVPAGGRSAIHASVVVTDSNRCGDGAAADVTVSTPPVATFTATPLRACETPGGTVIALDGSAAASGHPIDATLTYVWTVSEGTVSDPHAVAPTWLVAETGLSRSVTVGLVVTDVAGCRASAADQTIALHGRPVASFAVTSAPTGAPVSFDGSATSGGTAPLSLSWSFGDGTVGAGTNPTHVYTVDGSYPVRLDVTDAAGCTSSQSRTVLSTAVTGTLAATDGCEGVAVPFAATVSGGIPPYTYSWNFGDGTVGLASSPSTSHAYANAGSYVTTVTVTDTTGGTVQLQAPVVISGPPVISIAGPPLVTVGTPATFTASSGQPISSYLWHLPDGTALTGATISPVFATAGPQSLSVLATSVDGCQAIVEHKLEIEPLVTALSLRKSVVPGLVLAGDEVEYALVLGNGPSAVTGVVIRDRLPSELQYVPGTLRRDGAAMADPSGGSDLIFPTFDLAAATATTVRYRVRVRADAATDRYDNLAEASAVDLAGRPVDAAPAVATLQVTAAEPRGHVDLLVIKRADSDPAPLAAGGLVHYRIEYHNRGTDLATKVILVDDWPMTAGVIDDNGDDGVVLGGRIEWTVGDVAPGTGGRVQYTLRLRDDLGTGTAVRNVVTIASAEEDDDLSNNRSSTEDAIGGLPDLALTKTVATTPDPADSGALATYQIEWRNVGTGLALAAVIVDDYDETRLEIGDLPAGASDTGGILRFELGDIEPGASGSVTYTATVREDVDGAVENVATITSQATDPNPADNTANARFDIVKVPASLTASAELIPDLRCQQPQVDVAIRSDRFDVAAAMYAVAELLSARERLDGMLGGAAVAGDSIGPVLAGRLEAFAQLNVESLFQHSGMGLPCAGACGFEDGTGVRPQAPITIPFLSAHPIAEVQRQIDEPWCQHEIHRATTPEAIGFSLEALARYAEYQLDGGRPGPAGIALTQAGAIVTEVGGWLRDGMGNGPLPYLPAGISLARAVGDDGTLGEVVPQIADGTRSTTGAAAMVRGLSRLALILDRPGAAVAGQAATVRALAARMVSELAAAVEPGSSPDVGALALATEALVAAREAGIDVPADLVTGLSRASSAVGSDEPLSLDLVLAKLRGALALGQSDRAESLAVQLEDRLLDSRLGIYRSAETGAIQYTPARLGSVVGVLSRLAASGPPELRLARLERLASTVQKVAVEAGLQIGFVGREHDASGQHLIMAADGGVKISTITSEVQHTLAPVMVDAVTFVPQGAHRRDVSLVDSARGVAEEGNAVRDLSGPKTDCRAAQARLVDGRFRTETGLLATDAIDRAAMALREAGRTEANPLHQQLAVELAAIAQANRLSLGLRSGMGVALRFAPGVTDDLLERYAEASGLATVPAGLLPLWLEFASGQIGYAAPIDAASPYTTGWEPAEFDRRVTAAGLGLGLDADVAVARIGRTSDSPLERFAGRIRLHAATAKVELIAKTMKDEVAGFAPVLDASGRPLEMGRTRDGGLRGTAALLLGLHSYQALLADGVEPDVPVASDAAADLARRLESDVVAALDRDQRDPLALLYAHRALAARPSAANRRAFERAGAALMAVAPSDEVSPLAASGLALEAASGSGDGGLVQVAYRAIRDGFYDADWRWFRTGRTVEGASGDAFVISDLDVGSVLAALSAAREHLGRSEGEELAEMIHAVATRMLRDTGLQRRDRLEVLADGAPRTAAAEQIASAVVVTVADAKQQVGSLFPGDLLTGRVLVENPVPSSAADRVAIDVALGSGLRYVEGSARLDGKAAPDPAAGDVLTFHPGRLGGGQKAELSFVLQVPVDSEAGSRTATFRAAALSMPGPNGQPIAAPGITRNVRIEGYGAVSGHVFVDIDGDGHRSPAEPGVPHATVLFDDGTSTVSGADGGYRAERLLPATYRLRIYDASLPSFLRTEGATATVAVRSGATTAVDLGLSSGSTITGVVYRDANANRRMDDDETVVAGVVVEASDGQKSITDATGRYLIRGLKPGKHQLGLARKQPHLKDATDLRLRPLALPQGGVTTAGLR